MLQYIKAFDLKTLLQKYFYMKHLLRERFVKRSWKGFGNKKHVLCFDELGKFVIVLCDKRNINKDLKPFLHAQFRFICHF